VCFKWRAGSWNYGARFKNSSLYQVAEKLCLQAAQKDLRGEAREKSTSGGVLIGTL